MQKCKRWPNSRKKRKKEDINNNLKKTKKTVTVCFCNSFLWYLAGQQSHHQKMCSDPRRLWVQRPGSPAHTSHSGFGDLCCRSESTWKWGETLSGIFRDILEITSGILTVFARLTCSPSWRDSYTWGSHTAQSCAPWTGLAPHSALKRAMSAYSERWQRPGGRKTQHQHSKLSRSLSKQASWDFLVISTEL